MTTEEIEKAIRKEIYQSNAYTVVTHYLNFDFDVEDETGKFLLEDVSVKIAVTSTDDDIDSDESIIEVHIGKKILYQKGELIYAFKPSPIEMLIFTAVQKEYTDPKFNDYINSLKGVACAKS